MTGGGHGDDPDAVQFIAVYQTLTGNPLFLIVKQIIVMLIRIPFCWS